jgi:hypothetical protein
MNGEIRNGLILSAALASALCAAEPKAKLTALVYNYAAVSPDVLARAEREAGGIYEHVGIAIKWLDCPLSPGRAGLFLPCRLQIDPEKLAVRLLPQARASRMPGEEHAYGFAIIPEDGGFGNVANVFIDKVDQLAKRFDRNSGANLESGALLAIVITHEVAHLLLGAGSHSDTGIMRANWYGEELKLIAQHTITFTPAQVEKMRTNIRTRMAAEAALAINASPTTSN